MGQVVLDQHLDATGKGGAELEIARSLQRAPDSLGEDDVTDLWDDWKKLRRMGCDIEYLQRLGIWDYEDALKLRDRVSVSEQCLLGAEKIVNRSNTVCRI